MKISRSITYLLKKVFELSQTKNMFPRYNFETSNHWYLPFIYRSEGKYLRRQCDIYLIIVITRRAPKATD